MGIPVGDMIIEPVGESQVLTIPSSQISALYPFKAGQIGLGRETYVKIQSVEDETVHISFPPLNSEKIDGHAVCLEKRRFVQYLQGHQMLLVDGVDVRRHDQESLL